MFASWAAFVAFCAALVASFLACCARSRSARAFVRSPPMARSARVALTACQLLTPIPAIKARRTAIRQQRRAGGGARACGAGRRCSGGRASTASLREIALDVRGQAVGRFVAARAVLLQRLHHDPVEVAAEQRRQAGSGRCRAAGRRRVRSASVKRAEARRRARRLDFADGAAHLVEAGLQQFLWDRRAVGR